MKAIALQGDKKVAYVTDRAEPKLRPDYVLVDVKAVALNPTDWKHVYGDGLNIAGLLSGCDYAGVVADVGPDCQKAWKKGDRICGFAHGGNMLQPEDGAFAEKIVARSGAQMRIPKSMSFEDAAGMGVAALTVGQGLYQEMGLNWPNNPIKNDEWILIYGGSSGMGTVGIEFMKLSGYKVVTTCSPRNFDMVKSFGADEVLDYNDPQSVDKIKQLTNNNLKLSWDTIGVDSSAEFCGKVLAAGGRHGIIGPAKPQRSDITVTFSLGYTAAGEPVKKSFAEFGAEKTTRDYEWMIKWIELVDGLLAQGKVKPHPTKVTQGLENVIEGMHMLKDNKVSGQKLVYTL